ncbi:hypothetical protein FB45DRAFT_1060896 [Roridomyces roridus]|uniref:Uncharacterized protein n=1 Tax=Roridomyces roridus TaxID=1738132 RepID=A0AAD7FK26_9AGAR|nr:hypothetical protein FB45DRAFT_1060896 [Roridomyces roridus]
MPPAAYCLGAPYFHFRHALFASSFHNLPCLYIPPALATHDDPPSFTSKPMDAFTSVISYFSAGPENGVVVDPQAQAQMQEPLPPVNEDKSPGTCGQCVIA